jgi:hypothetical protein
MPLTLHPGHFGRDWSSSSSLQLLLPPSHRERGTGIGRRVVFNSCCFTTNAVDWVVWRSNHRAVPSSATTGPDLPVPTPRHGSPPTVPRLAPSSTAPCTVPRPEGPVYRHRGRWPFNVVPQDKCSLPSCRTFQFNVVGDVPGHADRAGPGRPRRCCSCFLCSCHGSKGPWLEVSTNVTCSAQVLSVCLRGEERIHKMRGEDVLGLETKLRLESQRYFRTV